MKTLILSLIAMVLMTTQVESMEKNETYFLRLIKLVKSAHTIME